jgi:uncharacterized Zn-binding protein involved in type VI secretion
MPLSPILIDGDVVEFKAPDVPALVAVSPGTAKAGNQSKVKINGKLACVVGDEFEVELPGKNYLSGGFVGGSGTLKIKALAPDQKASKVKIEGKQAILVGQMFIAEFQPQSPGKMPPPANTPDPMKIYIGQGKFVSKNTKVKGS